jgi:hypothetical protein
MKKYALFILSGFFAYLLMAEFKSQKSDLIFSHTIHIEEVGAGCTDCHVLVEKSEKGEDNLLPEEKICLDCHDQSETGCNFCHSSEDSIKTMHRIQSTKFNFSHKSHLEKQKDCLFCHSGIENKIAADQKVITDPLSICKKCHENVDFKENSAGCRLCHQKRMSLKPVDHSMNWQKEHGIVTENSEQMCGHCHQTSYCLSCHKGDNLDHEVHPLNFRNNHGILAKGNKDNCMTCHQNNNFCQDCHKIRLVKPRNHFLSNWVIFKAGSGGKHAVSAMADFDKCLSCHNDMNSDIICMQCHQN